MKVDQQNVSSAGTGSVASTSSVRSSGGTRSASVGDSSDRVDISGVSRAIQSFQGDRARRIGQIAGAVKSGSYSVDPSLISGSIVQEAIGATANR